MKNIRQFKQMISFVMLACFMTSCFNAAYSLPPEDEPVLGKNKIKIALLLDTSSSMSGLIEQAKSQLWKIVNQLAMAKKGTENADLEIALYQYGNDGLNTRNGYIENVLPLTSDLDEVSEKLFALHTNGGEEYCGHVIQTASTGLNWSDGNEALNLIFIAGNESFKQGGVSYKESCNNALNKGIIVNTIFCGDYDNGIRGAWKDGAILTGGNYSNIDMNQKTVYVSTPYDSQIEALNKALNKTYLAYGSNGKTKQMNQINQDFNSSKYGSANATTRTISKSSHLYKNEKWDLVDANNGTAFDINKVKTNELPEEMQTMNEQEKIDYIEAKATERKRIQKQIRDLAVLRQEYIDQQNNGQSENSLDRSMINAIKSQALSKGFEFADNQPSDLTQTGVEIPYKRAYVDFDFFETVTAQAKAVRKDRLINFAEFIKASKEPGTIILDTRSKAMYDRMHIKGAIHLNFSDFNQQSLAKIIPSSDTKILIYCNNNFEQEPIFREVFITKAAPIKPIDNIQGLTLTGPPKTLALNIPTFINLYGYGYHNVYELSELVSTKHPLLELEGTDLEKSDSFKQW